MKLKDIVYDPFIADIIEGKFKAVDIEEVKVKNSEWPCHLCKDPIDDNGDKIYRVGDDDEGKPHYIALHILCEEELKRLFTN